MKANQKFLHGDDEAVSPVIAVILMVAITVVLAATVYVWVSGFGSQSGNPQKSLSLTSAGAIATSGGDDTKTYAVASGTSGMKYSDIKFTLNGAPLECDDSAPTTDSFYVKQGGAAVACSATDGTGPSVVVGAGDEIVIHDEGGSMSGKTIRVLDAQANAVILTLTIG